MSEHPEIAARFTNPAPRMHTPFELITWPFNLVVKAGWTFHFDIAATQLAPLTGPYATASDLIVAAGVGLIGLAIAPPRKGRTQ